MHLTKHGANVGERLAKALQNMNLKSFYIDLDDCRRPVSLGVSVAREDRNHDRLRAVLANKGMRR